MYPALQRLEQKGWVESAWRTSELGRRAKYYTLTAAGRRGLAEKVEGWRSYVGTVEAILAH